MMNTTAEDELTGQAALYALGALDAEEARVFEEHIAEGCAACETELRDFECVVADLALAAPAAEPPANVRTRLLALASEETERPAPEEETASSLRAEPVADGPNLSAPQSRAARGFLVVRAGEGHWVETEDPGISYKLLFADRELGTYTTLVKMQPGARIPRHRHLGVEQCLVLEGDLRAGPVKMSAGDFNCSLPGSVHDEIATEGGALLLIVSPEKYEVVGPYSERL